MKRILPDVVTGLGAAAIAAGGWMLAPWVGVVLAGALLILIGLGMQLAVSRRRRRRELDE